MAEQTIKEWLNSVANTTQSSDEDSRMMENLLHKAGFSLARVVVGIVYLVGEGTIDFPPTDIHSMARMILKVSGNDEQVREALTK